MSGVHGVHVGVISDTHALIRPEALAALAGVDHILHAGDLVTPDILPRLKTIAPVTAVRGNNDRGAWAERLPDTVTVELGGVRIFMIHDLGGLERAPEGVQVVVSGHSHRPLIREETGVLYLNPGSAGPRRFHLPIAIAHLHVGRGRARAAIVHLEVQKEPP